MSNKKHKFILPSAEDYGITAMSLYAMTNGDQATTKREIEKYIDYVQVWIDSLTEELNTSKVINCKYTEDCDRKCDICDEGEKA